MMAMQGIFAASLIGLVICHNLQVDTEYGPVIGTKGVSKNGRIYHSFRGIPFAKPPVGDLRFKAPERPEKWTEPINATVDGPYCIQRNYLISVNPPVEGQEDCLYINVYTPKIHPKNPLPVMFSIHYGGFFTGRGTSDYYGPEYLMDKDLVFVSFNYRLGIMGFLTTLDDEAPGNYGLKDQVLALRWVQENIGCFGGDKNMVTIVGQSAGSVSVHFHLVSPLSKGLFHRAISESGSALSPIAGMTNSQQPANLEMQASLVNCSDYLGNSSTLIKCLREVPAEVLLETQDQFKVFNVLPYSPYWQVTEQKTERNPEPFLTKWPIEYIESGEFEKVPWIVSNVADEGLVTMEGFLRQSDTRAALNENFASIYTNLIMGLPLSTNDTEGLYEDIVEFYLGGDNFVNVSNPERIKGFIDSYGDRLLLYPAYQAVMLHSAMGHKPIWYFMFDYRGNYSYGDWFASTKEDLDYKWGVCHCDELIYLFKSPAWFPELKRFDKKVVNVMVNMWSNFVIHGDPNPTLEDYCHVNWSPVDIETRNEMQNENLCYLNFNGSYKSRKFSLNTTCGLYKDRMTFWACKNISQNFEGLDSEHCQ